MTLETSCSILDHGNAWQTVAMLAAAGVTGFLVGSQRCKVPVPRDLPPHKLMHQLTLRFSDQKLENRYRRNQFRASYNPTVAFLCVVIALLGIMASLSPELGIVAAMLAVHNSGLLYLRARLHAMANQDRAALLWSRTYAALHVAMQLPLMAVNRLQLPVFNQLGFAIALVGWGLVKAYEWSIGIEHGHKLIAAVGIFPFHATVPADVTLLHGHRVEYAWHALAPRLACRQTLVCLHHRRPNSLRCTSRRNCCCWALHSSSALSSVGSPNDSSASPSCRGRRQRASLPPILS